MCVWNWSGKVGRGGPTELEGCPSQGTKFHAWQCTMWPRLTIKHNCINIILELIHLKTQVEHKMNYFIKLKQIFKDLPVRRNVQTVYDMHPNFQGCELISYNLSYVIILIKERNSIQNVPVIVTLWTEKLSHRLT